MVNLVLVALQVLLELLRLRREHAARVAVAALDKDGRRDLAGEIVSTIKATAGGAPPPAAAAPAQTTEVAS